ncbi:MAG: hypothetical protein GY847_12280 [Proteobacteria bacterium]|nr:hypothetical protein [Pseudomonadota bacterium]
MRYSILQQVTPLTSRYKRDHDAAHCTPRTEQLEIPSYVTTQKELFELFQETYGRCLSGMYVGEDENTKKVGWVFEKREMYDDGRHYYICETWVALYRKCTHCHEGYNQVEIVKKPFNQEQE